jgi:hypothetical protein
MRVRPATEPRPFDPYTPDPGRMYNYWLGGHDNYQANRRRADEIEQINPGTLRMARNNRIFIGRAVRYAAGQGITQYTDLGCGLVPPPTVDDMARAIHPDAAVAYIDHDPEATARQAATSRAGLCCPARPGAGASEDSYNPRRPLGT